MTPEQAQTAPTAGDDEETAGSAATDPTSAPVEATPPTMTGSPEPPADHWSPPRPHDRAPAVEKPEVPAHGGIEHRFEDAAAPLVEFATPVADYGLTPVEPGRAAEPEARPEQETEGWWAGIQAKWADWVGPGDEGEGLFSRIWNRITGWFSDDTDTSPAPHEVAESETPREETVGWWGRTKDWVASLFADDVPATSPQTKGGADRAGGDAQAEREEERLLNRTVAKLKALTGN